MFVKVTVSISLVGKERPAGLVGESFTIKDKPLHELCLGLMAILRRYYMAFLTPSEVRAEWNALVSELNRLESGKVIEPLPVVED